jgi:hypothetical protein
VLDFWRTPSPGPVPVVVYIHGGGFEDGSKADIFDVADVRTYLDAGVSVASINYRFLNTAPIQDILRDCARAVQFIRGKHAEWSLDPARIGCFGDSAGAGASLWLAFHDDLADPASPDPVLRESSRITCAGARYAQATYDLVAWPRLIGLPFMPPQFRDQVYPFYHLKSWEEAVSPAGQKIRAQCDMLALASPGDAPVFLFNDMGAGLLSMDEIVHHPKHSEAIYNVCKTVGIPVVANLPALKIGIGEGLPADLPQFLLKYLKAPR